MILWLHLFHVKLVWRLSEFAFLCGYFGSRTFLLTKGIYIMKKKLSIVGMIFGVALVFVGILTLSGALGGDPSYPSFATPPYDSGYALFSSDYSTYSVNNSAEAASAARAAAYTIAHVAEFLTTFLGIMSTLLGLAVGGFSGIVFVYSGTAPAVAAPSAPTANNINYNSSAFETAERARKEAAERARKEAAERARKEAAEKSAE